jgi:hypothetical protein
MNSRADRRHAVALAFSLQLAVVGRASADDVKHDPLILVVNTFQNVAWGDWPDAARQKWDVASKLGEPARKALVGKSVGYYVDLLTETREKTLAEFRKRDDAWLTVVDRNWPWGPTNNYCKWFHVTKHEANHNGQIKLLKSRLPGAKSAAE